MRMLFAMSCLAVALLLAMGDSVTSAGQKDGDPKYTIKDVMQKAHKGGLLKKVTGGKASDAEAKELLAMYTALVKDKPPKGDAEDWKKRTEALVAGAKLVVDGKKDEGIMKLNDASKCADCHKIHKG
jgi:hypothetical protein